MSRVWILWSYDDHGTPLFEGVFSTEEKAQDVAQLTADKNQRGVSLAPATIDEHVPDRPEWPGVRYFGPKERP